MEQYDKEFIVNAINNSTILKLERFFNSIENPTIKDIVTICCFLKNHDYEKITVFVNESNYLRAKLELSCFYFSAFFEVVITEYIEKEHLLILEMGENGNETYYYVHTPPVLAAIIKAD